MSNTAIEALRGRGAELLPAIEEVVRRFRFEDASGFDESNLVHLLLIYFEKVADAEADVSAFVRSLPGRHLEVALRTIWGVWGQAHGPRRRRTIPKGLYDLWSSLDKPWLASEGKEDWLARFVADGSLVVTPAGPSV